MARRIDDEIKERFLDWLCTIEADRWPRTQKEWAEENEVSPDALGKLKKDPNFLQRWEAAYRRTVGSPERAHAVLEQLYETATDRTDPRQVQAAKQYLEAIDAVKPRKVEVTNLTSAKELSDEQLYEILAGRAAREITERA